MPEKTKTGKIIFPIRDAGEMQKDGWFIKKTKTEGISVRLARLKNGNEVVVQAYIFDTELGWTMVKAKKWLKEQGINWIAELNDDTNDYKGVCLKIDIIDGRTIMSEQKEITVEDGDGRKRTIIENPDDGLPKKIVRTPKKITTHREKKVGSRGKPLNINNKDYGRKTEEVITTDDSKMDSKPTLKIVVRTPRKKTK